MVHIHSRDLLVLRTYICFKYTWDQPVLSTKVKGLHDIFLSFNLTLDTAFARHLVSLIVEVTLVVVAAEGKGLNYRILQCYGAPIYLWDSEPYLQLLNLDLDLTVGNILGSLCFRWFGSSGSMFLPSDGSLHPAL